MPAQAPEPRGRVVEHLANERTHLAYVRTAIVLFTFGITLHQFSQFIAEHRPTAALVAGWRVGLGMVMASIGLSVLGGAHDDETGMLSGLNTTGHEIGGTFGIAALVTVATAGAGSGLGAVGVTGIQHAFLATGAAAVFGGALAAIVLPPARSFLPKLRLSPTTMPIH